MTTLPAWTRRALLSIFLVSGFTGLIYESVWSQYLKLFLGHAAYAQTLVLTIFMGGLALGSWIVARFSGRIRSLLWYYVLAEGTIGVAAILFHRIFVHVSDLSFLTVIPMLSSGLVINLYKWTLGSLLILPQSVLLGMTFPLISGGIIRHWNERSGETLSLLYFSNSLGAAIGVLVSGFLLLALVGLPGTILTAGLINVVLAIAVWVLIHGHEEPTPSTAVEPPSPAKTTQLARWLLIAAFTTGAACFMYELGWIRMLSLVLGSSTHSFELMLSAFILGLALGGIYVRKRVDRLRNPEATLGLIMLVMGMLAALTLPAYNSMFDFMAWALSTFTRTDSGYFAFNVVSQSIAILIMVPTTFCAGMTLPLLTHALMQSGKREGAIGTLYSVNTLGCIAGVLLTVHLLMPLIGVKGVILTGASLHVALGVSRAFRPGKQQWGLRVAAAVSVALLAVGFAVVKLDPLRMASGVFRTGLATLNPGAVVDYLRDGKTATVSLAEEAGMIVLATNGKPDASVRMGSGPVSQDEMTQILLAAIPLSMHPTAARVAAIGFGSGITTHSLLASPAVKQVDTIEIEPFMVEAARKGFGSRIQDDFADPRSHVVFEDAKTFFASSHGRYDLIVSEPSNPWVSGVASLFSDEFYQRISQYLNDDGYFAQWLQAYETDITMFASITKALSAHFRSYSMYTLDGVDILIVATRGGSMSPGDQIFQWPELRSELAHISVHSLPEVLARKIGDDRTLGVLLNVAPVPRNSDYFPYVDLNAARLRYLQTDALDLAHLAILPIPVLNLIENESPPVTTPVPDPKSVIARDRLAGRALKIRNAVLTGSIGSLDTSAASAVAEVIDMSAAGCKDEAGQHVWRLAARRISDLTASFLSPQELKDLWQQAASSPCYRAISGTNRAWVDLFAAVAQRDAPEMIRLGTQLLHTDSGASDDEERAYLVTAMGAAYIHIGEPAQAVAVLDPRANHYTAAEMFSLPLRELRALSRIRSTQPAVARVSAAPH
jgi:predicted membrane-bound spermidine synthase